MNIREQLGVLLTHGVEFVVVGGKTNSSLHPTTRSLLTLESGAQKKLLSHPARLATLLTRVPLLLPAAGYHVQARHQ